MQPLRAFPRTLLALTFLSACGTDAGGPPPGEPAQFEAVSPTTYAAAVGTDVSPAPLVRVTDAEGHPVNGAEVHFAVMPGEGSILTAAYITNDSGVATPGPWTLGANEGLDTLIATFDTFPPI